VIHSFSGAHPFRPQCLIATCKEDLDGVVEPIVKAIGDPISELIVNAVDEPEHIDDIDEDTPLEFVIKYLRFDVLDHVETLVQMIDAGRCPRCEDPLPSVPAGSKATPCRCIPVCSSCGDQEDFALISALSWPLDAEEREECDYEYEEALCRIGEKVTTMEVETSTLELQEHPGGWAEYGYDDTPDRDEVER
jgi:hypothetical protein